MLLVMARKKRSGPNISDAERNTLKLQIRCSPETAAWVRRVSLERNITLAEILEIGVLALEKKS